MSFSSDGLDFMIPYYKVISDSSDITIAPRNISDRGVGLETNYRKAHGKTRNLRKLDLIYFDEDDEFKKQNVENFDSRYECLKCDKPGTGTKDAPRAFSLKLKKVILMKQSKTQLLLKIK